MTQLVLGDVVLMKNNAYQGKRKVKDQLSETEYVVCQVADGVPAYEVRDEVGNVKTVHCNWLFLVATTVEAVTPLGAGISILEENVTRSTLAELTPLGIESDLPESSVEGTNHQHGTTQVGRRHSMATAFCGLKTDYVERVMSWRWSVESERQGSPLDLPVEPLNLARIF